MYYWSIAAFKIIPSFSRLKEYTSIYVTILRSQEARHS